jgi:hypothetical protein
MALQVFQFQFVLGGVGLLALQRWVTAGRASWGWSPPVSLIVLAVVGGLSFIPSSVPLLRPLWENASRSAQVLLGDQPRLRTQVESDLSGVLDVLPAGAAVLSDPQTSYYLSALAENYVAAIPYGHSSPVVTDDDRRRADVAAVLDPGAAQTEVAAILERYGMDYVLLNVLATNGTRPSLSTETFDALRKRFDADAACFQRVALPEARPDQRLALYRFIGSHGVSCVPTAN